MAVSQRIVHQHKPPQFFPPFSFLSFKKSKEQLARGTRKGGEHKLIKHHDGELFSGSLTPPPSPPRRSLYGGSPHSSKSNTHSPQHSFPFADEDGEDHISADPAHSDPAILSDAEHLIRKRYIFHPF